MNDAECNAARQFVEKWQRAGPALEKIRREELRNFKHSENVDLIDALLAIDAGMTKPRTMSGLAEQQRIFQKARHE